MNHTDASYHWKNWADWIFDAGEIKFWNHKNEHFEKKSRKSQKELTILHLMTTFYNVAPKIETSF